MTEASRQPKDKNYNLITVLYQSSENTKRSRATFRMPRRRATRSGGIFNGVLETNLEANRGKRDARAPTATGGKSSLPLIQEHTAEQTFEDESIPQGGGGV